MTGNLYVIGVGPGDPELLTLKALKILRDVPVLCVPKGREEGISFALSIVEKTINIFNKEIIEAHFPMKKTKTPGSDMSELDTKWQETADTILGKLSKGIDVAFITLGDPTIYSTFFYLYNKLIELKPDLKIKIIPGVSSINAAAARATISLGLADEKIAILPATYVDNIGETIEKFDTIVLMKVHRVFDAIIKTLNDMDLFDKAIYIARAGLEDEKIIRNIRDVKKAELDYFSLVIIKK